MESQSRYSIVERLTRSKLDIMDSKSDLDLEIVNKKQEISDKKKDLEQWEKDINSLVEKDRERLKREVERLESDLLIIEGRKEMKEKVYDSKITEISNALKAIQTISATAPDPKDQT